MNVAQALKQKNRLTEKLVSLMTQACSGNHCYENNRTGINTKALVDNDIPAVMDQLANIKIKIATATAPVADLISKMDSLKKFKTSLENYNTNNSPNTEYLGTEIKSIPAIVVYNDVAIEQMKDTLTQAINDIQDSLDTFNATTQV